MIIVIIITAIFLKHLVPCKGDYLYLILTTILLFRHTYYSHFKDKEIEIQRNGVICPRSQS